MIMLKDMKKYTKYLSLVLMGCVALTGVACKNDKDKKKDAKSSQPAVVRTIQLSTAAPGETILLKVMGSLEDKAQVQVTHQELHSNGSTAKILSGTAKLDLSAMDAKWEINLGSSGQKDNYVFKAVGKGKAIEYAGIYSVNGAADLAYTSHEG